MLIIGRLSHPTLGSEGNWFSLAPTQDDWGSFKVIIYRPDDTLIKSGLFLTLDEACLFLLENRGT